MSKKIIILPLLLIAVAVSAEPIVRVLKTDGSDKAFAKDEVHKFVFHSDGMDVVNHAGTVLMNVPVADFARVEFTDGTPTPEQPTAVDQVPSDQSPITNKFLRNGMLYILHNGTMYNVQGQTVRRIKN